jgi:RNA polymerase sigma-70 factor, ECF subfamily
LIWAFDLRGSGAVSGCTKPGRTWLIDECIEGARHGSSEAIGRLFELCRDYLIVIAREEMDSDLRAKAGASDIVQDTFLDAQKAFGRFRGRTEAELLAWLRQILLCHLANLHRSYHDTAKRDVSRELSLGAAHTDAISLLALPARACATPSWQAINREEVERVEAAIQRLSPDYQRVITLVSRQHRSFAEAGVEMNRSADAARRMWGRAIEKLAAELKVDHERR